MYIECTAFFKKYTVLCSYFGDMHVKRKHYAFISNVEIVLSTLAPCLKSRCFLLSLIQVNGFNFFTS